MPTKRLTQWQPKGITGGVKHHLLGQSLHPTHYCIMFQPTAFTISHFGPTQESFYSWTSASVMVTHPFRFLYLVHNDVTNDKLSLQSPTNFVHHNFLMVVVR